MSELLAIEGGQPAVDPFAYRCWPFYSKGVEKRIVERIRSGDICAIEVDSLIEEFEERFTKHYCPDSYAIFCGSGTAALFSAYFAIGLEYGAEVLVPTNTFRATVTPLFLLNLCPVLCDSDPTTGGIDLDDAEARITPRTQALVVTHIWGHPVNMDKACALASKHGLALIEDCSHAHGATWNGTSVGTFGNVAVFSLGTTKMVSGGTAGILVTQDRNIFERALILGQPKHRAKTQIKNKTLRLYLGSGLGANLRGTPIAAALALDHLERLPRTISIKNQNISKLNEALNKYLPDLNSPIRQNQFDSGTWYKLHCPWSNQLIPRDLILKVLQREGVLVSVPSPSLHREHLFTDPSPLTSFRFEQAPLCNPNDYPVADALFEKSVCWNTREFYEPADEIIENYAFALKKINSRLDKLLSVTQQCR